MHLCLVIETRVCQLKSQVDECLVLQIGTLHAFCQLDTFILVSDGGVVFKWDVFLIKLFSRIVSFNIGGATMIAVLERCDALRLLAKIDVGRVDGGIQHFV